MVDFRAHVIINATTAAREQVIISSMSASLQACAANVTVNVNFITAFESNVSVGERIAVRTISHPFLSQRFHTNDQQLQ